MSHHRHSLPPDLLHDLQRAGLETRVDQVTRRLYSTDASLYQIEPLGVAFPRTPDHLSAAVELAAQYGVPVIARGSGSGLAGQAIGSGLILDCARYLDKLLEIDPEAGTATVQPGLILDHFNRAVGAHGLQFGPDPASSERATLGGILGNNSTGAHSIQYGMAADHIREIEVVLSDGTIATFGEVPIENVEAGYLNGAAGKLYRAALDIRANYSDAIRQRWATVWRRASGYSLNYLLPWSSSAPPRWSDEWGMAGQQYPPVRKGHLNLAPLFVGSEGTLGVIRKAVVNLVKKPGHTILGVLAYDSIAAACDDTPRLLELSPEIGASAVELLTRQIIHLSRSVPAYARLIDFLPPGVPDPAALLVVEFAGDSPERLREQVKVLGGKTYIAESPQAQANIWKVRKVGLGLLMSKPGNAQPIPFIEDVAVPVEKLGDFVREIDQICAQQDVEAAYYAHASAGCLHIRPILDLRSERHVQAMRWIAERAIEAGLRRGGAVSGEHGDGLARSEWLEKAYGPEIMAAHRLLKNAADPHRIFNPGKIIDPPPMDQNLRFGSGYQSRGWVPTLSFERQVSLENAIEMCNGAGVCRKLDGFMCPSFQATREEIHSTRGRANLLRELIRLPFPVSAEWTEDRRGVTGIDSEDVKTALDLCLACKGCKTECPSGVDVAKLKYEFTQYYYQSHRRKLRDYLFGYIGLFSRFGAHFAELVNWGMTNSVTRNLFAKSLHLAPERQFPAFSFTKFHLGESQKSDPYSQNTCLLLLDPFTQYFYPEDGDAAIQVLQAAGYRVQIIPVSGAGRTLISKGFLKAAKKHGRKLVETIHKMDPDGRLPVVGIEPSEIYTLQDEYPDFFPSDDVVSAIARRAWMVDEFLLRQPSFFNLVFSGHRSPVLLHGHCYQKARPPADDGLLSGVEASMALLTAAGFDVRVIDSGCCGMAGAFGYEKEHFEISMQIGELALFPVVRQAGEDVIIAAAGVSCQAQIEDGTQRTAVHPIRLISAVLGDK